MTLFDIVRVKVKSAETDITDKDRTTHTVLHTTIWYNCVLKDLYTYVWLNDIVIQYNVVQGFESL